MLRFEYWGGRTTFSYLDDRNVLVEREVLTANGWVGTAATVFYRNELPLNCELGVPEDHADCSTGFGSCANPSRVT